MRPRYQTQQTHPSPKSPPPPPPQPPPNTTPPANSSIHQSSSSTSEAPASTSTGRPSSPYQNPSSSLCSLTVSFFGQSLQGVVVLRMLPTRLLPLLLLQEQE